MYTEIDQRVCVCGVYDYEYERCPQEWKLEWARKEDPCTLQKDQHKKITPLLGR